MFGTYQKTLDSKNRVIVPSQLRKSLGSLFYATLGPDGVLELRSQETFETWKERLLSNNMLAKDARAFARVLLGNTAELESDSQGRIILPKFLLEKVTITSDLVFVGVGNKVEIWNPTAHKEFVTTVENQGSLDDLAEKLLKNGAMY